MCVSNLQGLHMKKPIPVPRLALAGSGSLGFVASLWLVGKRNWASGAQEPVSAGYGVRKSRCGIVRSSEV